MVKKIFDICISSKLRIVNGRKAGDALGRFTCHKPMGSSVVDYVIVNENILKNILYFHVNSFKGYLSDHCCISWAIKCCCDFKECHQPNDCKYASEFPKQYKWNIHSIQKFQNALCSTEIQSKVKNALNFDYNNVGNTDDIVQQVTDILTHAASTSLNLKNLKPSISRKTRQDKKWFDKSLQEMKKEVSLNANLMQIYPNVPYIRHNFFSSLKRYNKTRKRKARHYREKILQQLDELKDKNPEAYWKLLKTLKNEDTAEKNTEIPLREWEMYFKYLNKDKYPNRNYDILKHLHNLEKEILFNETDFKITTHEISKCINKLKNKKSPGLDRLIPEMLKYSQHVMLPILAKAFNFILMGGKYPSKWLSGYIVPIYKKHDALNPSNYRGITILSCLGKLFNTVINERLTKYFSDKNIISRNQIGFKKQSRTTDHIFVLNALINKYIAKGKNYILVL